MESTYQISNLPNQALAKTKSLAISEGKSKSPKTIITDGKRYTVYGNIYVEEDSDEEDNYREDNCESIEQSISDMTSSFKECNISLEDQVDQVDQVDQEHISNTSLIHSSIKRSIQMIITPSQSVDLSSSSFEQSTSLIDSSDSFELIDQIIQGKMDIPSINPASSPKSKGRPKKVKSEIINKKRETKWKKTLKDSIELSNKMIIEKAQIRFDELKKTGKLANFNPPKKDKKGKIVEDLGPDYDTSLSKDFEDFIKRMAKRQPWNAKKIPYRVKYCMILLKMNKNKLQPCQEDIDAIKQIEGLEEQLSTCTRTEWFENHNMEDFMQRVLIGQESRSDNLDRRGLLLSYLAYEYGITNIVTMDGHGRFVLGYFESMVNQTKDGLDKRDEILKFNIPVHNQKFEEYKLCSKTLIDKIQLTITDISQIVTDYHNIAFPRDITNETQNMYKYRTRDNLLLYFNFCGIGGPEGLDNFVEYMRYQVVSKKTPVILSMSTVRGSENYDTKLFEKMKDIAEEYPNTSKRFSYVLLDKDNEYNRTEFPTIIFYQSEYLIEKEKTKEFRDKETKLQTH